MADLQRCKENFITTVLGLFDKQTLPSELGWVDNQTLLIDKGEAELLSPLFHASLIEKRFSAVSIDEASLELNKLNDLHIQVMLKAKSEDEEWLVSGIFEVTKAKERLRIIYIINQNDQTESIPFLDPWTGLWTLAGLHCIAKIEGLSNSQELLLLKIHQFSQINEAYGLHYGDELLRQTTTRIAKCVKPGAWVARIAKDEFVVLQAHDKDHPAIQSVYREMFSIDGHSSMITVRVKQVLCGDYETLDELILRAHWELNQGCIEEMEQESALNRRGKKEINSLKEKVFYKTRRRQRVIILCSFLVLFLLVSMSIQYLGFVRETIRQDSRKNLSELSYHIVQGLQAEIESTSNILEDIRLTMPWNKFESDQERVLFLKQQTDYWSFSDLGIIDQDGIWLHANGERNTLMNRQLLHEAMITQETVYEYQIFNNEDSIIFITPLLTESEGYLAITGTYAIRNWNSLMKVEIYNGEASTYVITAQGVMIAGNSRTSTSSSYNLLEALKNVHFQNNLTIDNIKNEIVAGNSGHLSYEDQGKEYYFGFSPIGFNNWVLAYTVPSSVVNGAGNQMTTSVVLLCSGVIMVVILAFLAYQINQKKIQQRLWTLAYQDETTEGPNKNLFELAAKELLASKSDSYVLVYMNILQFKLLNSRFGKQEADNILRKIDEELQSLMSENECFGRLNADNFILLMKDSHSLPATERLEQFAAQTSTMCFGDAVYQIRLVFGVVKVNHNLELTQLIDRANLAMKNVPQGSDCCWIYYDEAMMKRVEKEKELREGLLLALAQKELCIYLQPKISLTKEKVEGAEALVRWIHPEKGMISPGEFIPLAERTGIVRDIDRFVFEQVCELLNKWVKEGQRLFPISFNLSRAQLDIPNFLDYYRNILNRYDIPASMLEFEFTESLMFENTEILKQAVHEIHEMGCRCSVDDFGSGYSSLSLLGQFDADTLKLDRSFFLSDPDPASRTSLIVKSSIHLAKEMGMSTVAEGVECKAYILMLRQFGCDEIQGYVYSQPLSIPDFEDYLQRMEKFYEKE